MFFSLDVLRARKGDCLMLHYGSKDDPHLILIDGGPSKVYKPHLAPRIAAVHRMRKLAETDPLPVDVVMVSHVDDDHIKGILELTQEQLRPNPAVRLRVDSLWHNSFDDLLNTRPDELIAGFGAASVSAGAGGGDPAFDPGEVLAGVGGAALRDFDLDEDEEQTAAVLASIPQGRTLRLDAEALRWEPNREADGKLIVAREGAAPLRLRGGLTMTVAGPMQQELAELQELHDKWVREHKDGRGRAAAATLAAYTDKSVPNLSSLVLLAEFGGKRMLLTGDARGDKILEGLELAGLLDAGGKLHVELLKVPHHGSDHNMETEFFARVTADHYVFSGDGEHGNPERATLQMLLDGRGDADDYVVHLTYPVDEIDQGREAETDDWSAQRDSLAALFAANPRFAAKVAIVGEGKPHLINLLQPV